jgi:O-antigen/teichoic acid export membrane protein
MSRPEVSRPEVSGADRFDDVEGRARSRSSSVLRAALSGAWLRIVSALGGVVVTPIVVRHLGDARYGVFATVTALAGVLVFADLGLGNGLMTRLASMSTDEESRVRTRVTVSSGAALLAGAAGLVLVGFLSTLWVIPWDRLLGSAGLPIGEVRATVAVFGVLFSVGIALSLGQRVLLGLQHGLASNLWQVGSTVLALLLVALVSVRGSSVAWLVLASAGPMALGALGQCWWAFGRVAPWLRPRVAHVDAKEMRQLVSTSGLFLVLAVAVAIAYQTDQLVVASTLGAATAAVLAVSLRLYALVGQTVSYATLQIWPAFAAALGDGDLAWARRAYHRALLVTGLVSGSGCLLLVIAARPFVRWWLGPSLVPPWALLVGLALWTTYAVVVDQAAYLLNAAHVVRAQVIMAVTMTALNLPLSIVLAHRIGVSGPVWASLVSHLLVAGVPCFVLASRIVRDGRPSAGAALPAANLSQAGGEPGVDGLRRTQALDAQLDRQQS